MERYLLDVRFDMRGVDRRVMIRTEAATDDEALRIGNALADLVDFEGASLIQVVVSGAGGRDVGVIGGAADQEHYLDRAVTIGVGYRTG